MSSPAGATPLPRPLADLAADPRNPRGIGAPPDFLSIPPVDGWPQPCMILASLFAGCGGLDLGFGAAGIRPVWANEWDRCARASYSLNIGAHVVGGDVRDLRQDSVPDTDVIAGGFPCVAFSTAGRRAGILDNANGRLYLEMLRIVSEKRPRYFVAENVRGLLSANGGLAFKIVLRDFLRAGYRVQWALVNFADWNVPQRRERVLIMGVRADQWRGPFHFPPRSNAPAGDPHEPWLPRWRTLAEALYALPESSRQSRGPSAARYGDRLQKRGRATDTVASINRLFVCRVARSDVALRRMTPRECARVQSFPDWFQFVGSQSAQYRQMGNAVPPWGARRLATAIIAYDRLPVRR